MPDDPINPSYYKGSNGLEVFDVAEAFGLDKDAYLFTVLKYIVRSEQKGGIKDLQKAQVDLNRAIQRRIGDDDYDR